jgi:serine-type D-Ala-D-Ala carboxypeptidase (penicillin-binding protein 5/6)
MAAVRMTDGMMAAQKKIRIGETTMANVFGRRLKKGLFLLLLEAFICVSISSSFAAAKSAAAPVLPQGPELAAEAWILIDPVTGRDFASRNPDVRRSPASTTKIMTALIALELVPTNTLMTASAAAINSVGGDYVRAGILPGETLTLRSLLEMMMITSANEAGYVIAENLAPDHTVAGFIAMMNAKAAALGISPEDTHFTNPCGIEDENHYTTARSLAIMAREAMKLDEFKEIVKMTSIVAPDTNLRKSADWKIGHLLATNELISNPAAYGSKYFTATGMKTGYTALAGRCLVSSGINPDGMELISVVLGAEKSADSFRESRRLLEFGFTTYARADLKLSGEYYGRFDVQDAADNGKVTVNTLGTVSWLMPVDEALAASITTESAILPPAFLAPITKGQVLGELQVVVLNTTIGSVKLVADNTVEKSTWADIRDRYLEFLKDPVLLSVLKTTAVLVLLLLLLRLILKMISRRRNRRKYISTRKNNYRIDHFRK